MFFSRQACAVESAAMRSGLSVSVVMTADRLTLDDNTTCQLVRSSYGNINFYSVNIEKLAKGSPLGLTFLYCFHIYCSYFQNHSSKMPLIVKVKMPLCISLML